MRAPGAFSGASAPRVRGARAWRVLLAVLLAGAWLARAGASHLEAPGQPAQQVLVCGHSNYPPVSWTQHKTLQGAGPMVARDILQRLGYAPLLLDVGNWKRCLSEVKAGRVDMVAGGFYNAQRAADMVFLPDYLVEEPIMIYVNRQHAHEYQSRYDLRGKTVGLLLGDIYGQEFDDFLRAETRIEWVSSGSQNLGKLARGRIDFMPIGAMSGALQAQLMGVADQVQPIQVVVSTGAFYFGIAHGSPLLAHFNEINAELLRLRHDGSVARLLREAGDLYLRRQAP